MNAPAGTAGSGLEIQVLSNAFPEATVTLPLAELDAKEALIFDLTAALVQAAQWFEGYAAHHQEKGGLDKASRNLERANYCRRASAQVSA